jgi:hypothetical protein
MKTKIKPRLNILMVFIINLIIERSQALQYEDNLIKIAWVVNDQNTTNFTMSCSNIINKNYIAFGLSNDEKMVLIKICKIYFLNL